MMANNVFDKMNDAASRYKELGGKVFNEGLEFLGLGAISSSDYEQNMAPNDQSAYEDAVVEAFEEYYDSYLFSSAGTPLSFNLWIKTVDSDNIEDQAQRYSEQKDHQYFRQQENFQQLSIADKLQKLAHLHTGRIVDLAEIVSSMDIQDPNDEMPIGGQLPPEPGLGPEEVDDSSYESSYEGGGDQGPF